MSENRPKLLVLDGPLVPAEELARVLKDRYDVDVANQGAATERLATGAFQVVMGGTQQLASPERALADLEAAAVLGAIGEGLCLATLDGQIVWANERFRSFDDQTRARIGAVCRRAAQRFNDQMKAAAASGGPDSFPPPLPASNRFDVATPDESKYFEVVVSPVPGIFDEPENHHPELEPTGPIHRVAAVVWNVTTARRTQQKMDAIDRAGAELVRLDADLIRKMHVGDRLKLLEDKIVRFSHDLLHFDHLAIRLIDERSGKLELVMACGLPPEAMELELYAKREGNGIMGYVAATGRSYLCGDVTQDPRYVRGIANARASLTVPLRLHDKVIGAFNVESERVNAFTEEDRQFAEMFATHIALALHILDLLVVERRTAGEAVSGTVEGELSEPLNDILHEIDELQEDQENEPSRGRHIERIRSDVEAIRRRVREAAQGPQHILGAEKALTDISIDPALAGKRVLVADDEGKMRQTIREILRSRGCVVVLCENGRQAIEALEAAAAGNSRPFDLLVSDIRMPDHNGYEVFAAAKRAIAGIPTILMTGFGYDPHHSIVRASQEGLQAVLFKPFQAERLLEEVRKALGANAPAAP
jgi:CheY-like chemotaxis protein